MNAILNLLITIVAIGTIFLFATFFIVLGLHKREIREIISKFISFK